MSLNAWTFSGFVGADAELRDGGGTKVLNFRVCATTGYGNAAKDLWVRCAVWGGRAEGLTPLITKGLFVTVIGEIGLEAWEKDGKHGATVTVRVSDIDFPPQK